MHDIAWKKKKVKRVEIKDHIRRFLLYPAFWNDAAKQLSVTLTWKRIKFAEDNFDKIPTNKGIYCFVVIPPYTGLFTTKYLFYIGKASGTSLKSRYKNYIDEKNGIGIGKQKPRVKIEEMLNEYLGHIYFYYAVLDNKSDIVDCENKLLNTFFPYVNSHIPEATVSEEYKHIY